MSEKMCIFAPHLLCCLAEAYGNTNFEESMEETKISSSDGSPKTGLVLEGGGMRGMFSSGVIDVMMEHGIRFDGAVGVSAGACFGVNMKSGQVGRAIRYQKSMCGNKQYMSLQSLWRTGNLVNAEYAYHTVPMEIDIFDIDAAAANPMEFVVVCTDVVTGQPVYHPLRRIDYEELEWIRASASLPMVAQPVPVGGMRLMDGGLSDSIPLKYMQERGYARNVVILTQPLGYRKPPARHLWAMRWSTRHYPAVLECLRRRPEMYNRQLDYVFAQQQLGDTLIIVPDHPLKIGRLELKAEKFEVIYEEGRRICEANLERIRNFVINPSYIADHDH